MYGPACSPVGDQLQAVGVPSSILRGSQQNTNKKNRVDIGGNKTTMLDVSHCLGGLE